MKKKEQNNIKRVSNLQISKDQVIVTINTKVYPMDIIYSAAYVFLDRAFIVLDGDPAKEIFVELRPRKKNITLEQLGRAFNDELLNYSVYILQSEKNRQIREMILKKALSVAEKETTHEESYIDDPLGIARPWEEAHKED
jgi:His-Xaa-Ser system protein HxsD